jgi:hypothetical protein
MLQVPRVLFKESAKYVLFCNSTFMQVFHNETLIDSTSKSRAPSSFATGWCG